MCDTVIVPMTNGIEWNHVTPYFFFLFFKDNSLFHTSVTLSHFSFLDTGGNENVPALQIENALEHLHFHTLLSLSVFSPPLRRPPLSPYYQISLSEHSTKDDGHGPMVIVVPTSSRSALLQL